ncbi:MAG: tetratricopeptide repeat protein [Gemmatimonadetes bacterium]|nr:tetratricopeptide repeat protein [Gemmatimonadota bacterium]
MKVQRSWVALEDIFPLLPDLSEMEDLRLGILAAALPDPQRTWDRSQLHSTIDKRVISADRLEATVAEMEVSAHGYVETLFSSLRPLFQAFFAGENLEAARCLIELGERQEATGRYRKARQCYGTALSLSLPLVDKRPQILALRRIGRVALALAELKDAILHYRRSAELAHHAGELHDRIIALTGCGNVLAVQGQGPDAERCYREALALLESAPQPKSLSLERAQLYNNLGMIATRQDRITEAEQWLTEALDLWVILSSPVDLAVCYHNLGILRAAQGKRAEARTHFEEALRLDIPPSLRAGISVDLADAWLADGHSMQAKKSAREAEEYAITARSPYHLGHMYRGLGNIARVTEGDDGFTFFEKALEIAREKGYPLLEGETLMEYALLRDQMGEREEAEAYLERAREIFIELGADRARIRAECLLEVRTVEHAPAALKEIT